MNCNDRWTRFKSLLRAQVRGLATTNPSDLRWQMPFAAVLASSLPLLVGLVGGVCLHRPRFRTVMGRQVRRLTPSRLMP